MGKKKNNNKEGFIKLESDSIKVCPIEMPDGYFFIEEEEC